MQPRISMITLGVSDLTRSKAFYEALGFPRQGNQEGTAFYKLKGSWLSLYPRDELAADAGVPSSGSGFRGVTLAHNVNSGAEVERVIAEAVAAGAQLIKKAERVFWGGYSGYVADPDGHLWEIAHNPHSWIGPEDEA